MADRQERNAIVTVPRTGVDSDAARVGVHVARQPILDHRGTVFGYELLYRGSIEATESGACGDEASARVLTDAALTLGFDTLTGGRPAFVNFTRALLLNQAATLVPPSSLVVEVREDVAIDRDVIDACQRLNERGYALGLDDFVSGSDAEALLPFVKFIKVDVLQTSAALCGELAKRFRPQGIRLIAEKVETAAMADTMQQLGYQMFQGYFFCRPTTFSAAPLTASQMAYLRLIGALNRDELTVGELEDLVKADVSLTYRVLRSVNSAAFGMRREVSSLKQALLLLGRDQIRRWVSVWALAGMNEGQTEELLALALVRARCCEAVGRDLPGDKDGGFFLLGLCSLLDAILRRPMAAAIAEVPLPAIVKGALLGQSNDAREVLDAVAAYERGAWDACAQLLDRVKVPFERLSSAYGEALRWAGALVPEGRVMLENVASLFARTLGSNPQVVLPLPQVEAPTAEALAAVLDAAPDGIALVDAAGTMRIVNDQLHRMLGYLPGALSGQRVDTIIPERFRFAHTAYREGYQASPHIRRMGRRIALSARRIDGTELPVDIGLSGVRIAGVPMTLAFVRDASEQQALYEELAASKARLEVELWERQQCRALADLAQTPCPREEVGSILNLHLERLFPQTVGVLSLVNASQDVVDALVTWGVDDAVGAFPTDACLALRNGRVHLSGGDNAHHVCLHVTSPADESICIPIPADGRVLGLLHIQACVDPPAFGSQAARARLSEQARRRAIDVAERLALPLANIQLREQLLEQSIRDPLTGLYNRRRLEEWIAGHISDAASLDDRLAVVMLDLDHFKRFNDTFGHAAGDRLLKTFAHFLQHQVRAEDVLFRYGGEEFVLVLPRTGAEAAKVRLDALRDRWLALSPTTDAGVATFSAGIAEYPGHGSTTQDILRVADGALYDAKLAGRNRVLLAAPSSTPG